MRIAITAAARLIGRSALFATLALAAFAAAPVAAQDVPAYYTAEQAVRGERIYRANCAGCHGLFQLEDALQIKYRDGATFYNFISGSMPYDGNQLPAQQYTDIMSFLMQNMGYPAGDAELTPDRAILAQIVPGEQVFAPTAEVVVNENLPALYTAEQATAGGDAFAQSCGGCHGFDMIGIFATYPTAKAYFDFITVSMPFDQPGTLSTRRYLSIIAWLMQQNGFPAGTAELTDSAAVLSQIIPTDAVTAE